MVLWGMDGGTVDRLSGCVFFGGKEGEGERDSEGGAAGGLLGDRSPLSFLGGHSVVGMLGTRRQRGFCEGGDGLGR